MTIKEMMGKYSFSLLTKDSDTNKDVKSAYSCDLLSWVMSHGTADMALITIHTHLNVIAIATLLEMACVIIPEKIAVPQEVIEKATEENVCILQSEKTAYEICGMLYAGGLQAAAK